DAIPAPRDHYDELPLREDRDRLAPVAERRKAGRASPEHPPAVAIAPAAAELRVTTGRVADVRRRDELTPLPSPAVQVELSETHEIARAEPQTGIPQAVPLTVRRPLRARDPDRSEKHALCVRVRSHARRLRQHRGEEMERAVVVRPAVPGVLGKRTVDLRVDT